MEPRPPEGTAPTTEPPVLLGPEGPLWAGVPEFHREGLQGPAVCSVALWGPLPASVTQSCCRFLPSTQLVPAPGDGVSKTDKALSSGAAAQPGEASHPLLGVTEDPSEVPSPASHRAPSHSQFCGGRA